MSPAPSTRPSVDVLMPFAGDVPSLERALAALASIDRAPGDTVTLVDNRPSGPSVEAPDGVTILGAPRLQTSYHARNVGIAATSNPWIVFVDADVEPAPDLLEAYFEPAPADDVGLLVGRIHDAPTTTASTAAERYTEAKRILDDAGRFLRPHWAYAQTANCAARRAAIDEVGVFVEEIISGGDADLSLRLRRSGWKLERRRAAIVVHRNRTSVKALLSQLRRYGAGSQWLNERYPGFSPPESRIRLVVRTGRKVGRACMRGARGDRREAQFIMIEVAGGWAFALGRSRSNLAR